MAEDYNPRSFLELERRFSTESGCRANLWAGKSAVIVTSPAV